MTDRDDLDPQAAGYLRHALRLAARGRYRAAPNPMVGAVLVKGGKVVGTGYHRRVGGPHAEIEALRVAGSQARGSTLYVTLEPCSHHGRTPPCAEAVIDAGIRKVVACHGDPDPRVGGKGFAKLRAAGIDVEVGALMKAAVRLNWRFLVATVYRRPAVTLKWAMSLDGKIATASGESQWISSPAGRRWGLMEREVHDAILVGSGTALADDPRLDRRLGQADAPNVRVVLDRRLRMSAEARMLTITGPVLVYTESQDDERVQAIESRGATVVRHRQVTPPLVVDDLYRRGIRSLLVEGGSGIAAAFSEHGTFDRVAIDCAPILIGGRDAAGPLGGRGSDTLAAAPRLTDLEVHRRGGDLILTGFHQRCLPDLYASVDVS